MTDEEDHVQAAYDVVASAYAERFFDELSHKPLDRALLAAFVEQLPSGASIVADIGCGPGSFHAGDEVRHVDAFLGRSVSLDFRCLPPAEVERELTTARFDVLMTLERRAYEPFEVATRRGYVIAGKPAVDA